MLGLASPNLYPTPNQARRGRLTYTLPLTGEEGAPNLLVRNNGAGGFEAAAELPGQAWSGLGLGLGLGNQVRVRVREPG